MTRIDVHLILIKFELDRKSGALRKISLDKKEKVSYIIIPFFAL